MKTSPVSALVRIDQDDSMPAQLVAIHEITQLSRSYTNTPTEAGRAALTELIERLQQEAAYLENPAAFPDFYHLGIHYLMTLYRSFDSRVSDINIDDGYAKWCEQYRHFCLDWVARLSAWLDDNERRTETANRITCAHVFLKKWYSIECNRMISSNRGHPRDLARAGIIMPEALAALERHEWRPKS